MTFTLTQVLVLSVVFGIVICYQVLRIRKLKRENDELITHGNYRKHNKVLSL